MDAKDVSRTINIFGLIYIIISFISGFIIMMWNRIPDYDYRMLAILPIAFAGISSIFYKVYNNFFKKISITIIISLFFLRMTLIPLGIIMTDQQKYMEAESFLNNANQTIFIIVYEFFCVMLMLFILSRKNKESIKVKNNENENMQKNTTLFNIVIVVLCLFAVILYIRYPVLKDTIRTLFEDSEKIYLRASVIKSSMPSILYNIFNSIFDILYIVLPFLIILTIYKSRFSINIKIFISLFIIGIFACIATIDKFKSIIMAFSLLMLLIYLYPSKRKIIISILCTVGVGVMFLALILKGIKANSSYNINDFVEMLQAYFSGPFGISVGFDMNNEVSHFHILINDIISSFSYIRAFFTDVETTVHMYNVAFYHREYLNNKIVPMISQSAYYFGMVLSPIISCLFTSLALKLEGKLERKRNLFSKYVILYTVIYLSVSIVAYNMSIVISGLTGTILPLYILVLINRRRDKQKNVSNK